MTQTTSNLSKQATQILCRNGWHQAANSALTLTDSDAFWGNIAAVVSELATVGYFPTANWFRSFVENGRGDGGISAETCFEQRDYCIRNAELSDMPQLLELEALCWIEPLRADSAEIEFRINNHHDGNLLIERDGKTAGVIYSQRIDAIAPIFDHTFRSVNALNTPDGKIAQALAVNVYPDLQKYALGDQLLEFLLRLATFSPAIEGVTAVTICRLFNPKNGVSKDDYIDQRNEFGQPVDPILNFHHAHGAKIDSVVRGYRPADVQNESSGVLVVYDLQNRLSRQSKPGEVDSSLDIPAILDDAVRTIMGDKRAAGFSRNRALMELGFDSLELLELRGLLSKQLGIALEPTFFFSHSSVDAMIAFFAASSSDDAANAPIHSTQSNEPIAIIGMSCRFPAGVTTPAEFWSLLHDGVDAISEIPANRWDADAYFGEEAGQIRTRYGGFIDQVDQFDAPFFRIAPVEATAMDPQQRLLLETHWEALENAGIDPTSVKNSDTGIYVGIFTDDYRMIQAKQPDTVSAYFGTGTSNSVAAGRIAYFLGTEGTTLSVDTACSSSLVAIHLACQSLRSGESSLAMASGVNLMLSPELSVAFSQANMLARDGRCKTFDAAANGYVRSEGCGVVVLKRLSEAQADGDNILALVRGTALNQDGASNGLTAPNGLAQQAVIRKALAAAQLQPNDIDYVEAHGTGTPLGDPIEVNALEAVYGVDRSAEKPLIVGSVKTNIGHAESAAGVAGVMKVVLSLQNEHIPPHLHFNEINPHLAHTTIDVPSTGRDWAASETPRRGAISSFGFSGTNAHIILEEAPVVSPDLRTALSVIGNPYSDDRLRSTDYRLPKIAFLFTGQGAQYFEMGRDLYKANPAFRTIIEQCDAILRPQLATPLLDVLFNAAPALINDTTYTQPALFAIEYGLATLWQSWGVAPDLLIGHSIGEIAAACFAGVFSLEDGLKLVEARGRLMGALPHGGAMISCLATEVQVRAAIKPYGERVSIAAINGTTSVVIAGEGEPVQAAAAALANDGVKIYPLTVSHAFHSALMEPMLDDFRAVAETISYHAPQLRLVSNVTGKLAGDEVCSAEYWVRHVREAVRFADGIETALADNIDVFLEVGPQPTLIKLAQRMLPAGTAITCVASLNKAHIPLIASVSELLMLGVRCDLDAIRQSFESQQAWQLLMLSAKSEDALRDMAQQYSHFLDANPTVDLAALCQAARVSRADFSYRISVVGDSAETIQQQLNAFIQGHSSAGHAGNSPQKTAFLFTGQGAQYFEMGRDLYETLPAFRAVIKQCDAILRPLLATPLVDVLFNADPALINDTTYTQPALFAIEYALATLWQSWGIAPDLLVGHSIGEIAAACFAGVFSLEDGLKLVEARGRLMGALPRDGEMVSFLATEAQVAAAIAPYSDSVSIAAINGPESVVISGSRAPVLAVAEQLKSEGIKTKQLTVSHAFHSPLMEPMLEAFRAVATIITYHAPKLPLISNLTGQLAGEEIATADYWVRHVRGAVRFADGVNTLFDEAIDLFIEVGPNPTLLGLAARMSDKPLAMLPSLRAGQNDWQQLLSSVGDLYQRGIEIDWSQIAPSTTMHIDLPTYPFQRKRYWVDLPKQRNLNSLRPLIDKKMRLAQQKQTVFEKAVSTDTLTWLRDHHVYGEVVMPGAGYTSLALSAAELLFDGAACVVSDLVFAQPLILHEEQEQTVQLIVDGQNQRGKQPFQLISFDEQDEESEPLTHAMGNLTRSSEPAQTVSLADLQAACAIELSAENIYRTLANLQVNLGSSFRWINQLWHDGDKRILAQLQQPLEVKTTRGYQLFPAIIDACFQLAYALDEEDEKTRLPFALQSLTFYQSPKTKQPLWAVGQNIGPDQWDIDLFSADGQLFAALQGFELREAAATAFQTTRLQTDWLQTPQWQVVALEKGERKTPDRWLIVGEETALTRALLAPLKTATQHSVETAVQAISAERGSIGVVYAASSTGQSVPDATQASTVELLSLVQGIVSAEIDAQLWIVTQDCQSIADDPLVDNAAHGALWGFGRTLRKEYPRLNCTLIDSDPTLNAEQLSQELLLGKIDENEVAFRNQTRYVAQLGNWQAPPLHSEPMRLQLSDYGSVDSLAFVPMTRRLPAAGEVEIQVTAVGLNFRDVLISLGMLAQYYADVLGIHNPQAVNLGFESVGVVSAVGEGVHDLAVGDRVMGVCLDGSMASYLTLSAEQMTRIPDHLTDAEAATLPLTYLTAWYGLVTCAKLQKGERVLIHSAAGGVGQAAVQIAHAIGAEVIGTASPRKWAFLKEQGVARVMNSRTLDFADDIAQLTAGQGVDVVLNSLSGEFIERSFAALADAGRFVEMGKIGIWTADDVQQKQPNASYFPFDLREVLSEKPQINQQLWGEIKPELDAGHLQPLPYIVFPAHDAPDAFRYMQRALHKGKIVLSFDQSRAVTLNDRRSYLITGGLGALGLQTAEQLVADGARHLVLTSRRGVTTDAQQAAIDALTEAGATVQVAQADIANREDVERMIAGCTMPLGGVIHAAGVLDDGVLTAQSAERIASVMRPKVAGTWHLHTLTQHLPLDFFISFSSTAAVIGSAGQTNYAAANAFMDSLMQQRQQMGIAGLSINWGPWGEVGMAAHLQTHMQAQGMSMIMPQQGRLILHTLLQQSTGHVSVVPMKRETVTVEDSGVSADLYDQLVVLSVEEQAAQMDDYLRREIATILRLDTPSLIDKQTRLFNFGLDSLMAIELKNRIENGLNRSVRSTLLFDYPTLGALTPHLLQDVLELGVTPPETNGHHPIEATLPDVSEEEIDDFSSDELLAFLDAEFDDLS